MKHVTKPPKGRINKKETTGQTNINNSLESCAKHTVTSPYERTASAVSNGQVDTKHNTTSAPDESLGETLTPPDPTAQTSSFEEKTSSTEVFS